MSQLKQLTLSPAERAKAFCDALTVPYSAEFVPQSKSRHAKAGMRTLNWRITFGTLVTDYSQGIGHMPDYGPRVVANQSKAREYEASEKGVYYPASDLSLWRAKKLPAPALVDVLYSLVMDASVLDYDTFADWASDFGYDSDSIKAKKIYKACRKIAVKLNRLIDLDAAREAFQDY